MLPLLVAVVAPEPGDRRNGSMRLRERAAWVIAAGAAVLLFAQLSNSRSRSRMSTDGAVVADRERSRCVAELESLRADSDAQRAALSIIASQSSRIVVFAPQWGAPETVKALLDLPQHRGMILSAGLTPRPGKEYRLWMIRGQAPPRPAGVLEPQASGAVLAAIDPALLEIPPDSLAISLEPQGGAPVKPSADIVFIGNILPSN